MRVFVSQFPNFACLILKCSGCEPMTFSMINDTVLFTCFHTDCGMCSSAFPKTVIQIHYSTCGKFSYSQLECIIHCDNLLQTNACCIYTLAIGDNQTIYLWLQMSHLHLFQNECSESLTWSVTLHYIILSC